MDSLLCDEVCLSSSSTTTSPISTTPRGNLQGFCILKNEEDFKDAFAFFLQNEVTYMPKDGYMDRLMVNDLISIRLRVMQWLIKVRSQLNLSFGTLFIAANCVDRFLSTNQCHGWDLWMFELLSVSCLSIASKFNDTTTPTLHEIQMEDLDHSFQSSTIQRMELVLLRALDWRLGSTTAYSYIEIMTDSLKPHSHQDLTTKATEILLGTLLDYKYLDFRPYVIAVSTFKCGLEELFPLTIDAHISLVSKLNPMDQKDDLIRCEKMMKDRLGNHASYNLLTTEHSYYHNNNNQWPSSPVTVLLREKVDSYDSQIDFSAFQKLYVKRIIDVNLRKIMKRKREDP